MTVTFLFGRRVPKRWAARQLSRVRGLMTFQENIWLMINQAMTGFKRKCNNSDLMTCVKTKYVESESLNYNIEWLKIIVKSSPELEREEYDEFKTIYKGLDQACKDMDVPDNSKLKGMFNSKMFSKEKMEDMYNKGREAVGENNISNKLLEMGILVDSELVDDYATRDDLDVTAEVANRIEEDVLEDLNN